MKKLIALLSLPFLVLTAQGQHTYREISLPALMKKHQQDASNMIIVDVRSDAEYYDSSSRYKNGNIGRIKGVQHIDVGDLESKPESLKLLEQYKDKEVYLICSHSYRSRNASNILMRNGFKNVNNVQGGMSEWYRRYEELAPYRGSFETSVRYTNTSGAQLYEMLSGNSNILLIGINVIPNSFFDSANMKYLGMTPTFKKAIFFNNSDSAKILELAKKNAGKPLVLFNNYSFGAAEMADYLANQGIKNVQYLVGGTYYFLEYVANNDLFEKAARLESSNNNIKFISPIYFCNRLAGKEGTALIDVRHDTLFNKLNRGIKSEYKHLKNALNFPATKGAAEFEKTYPDKKTAYILVSRGGNDGLELADELSKKGYNIHWMLGGIGRYDWHTANVETLNCKDHLIRL